MQNQGTKFVTFAASFREPNIESQMEGAEYFYTLLKNLHNIDRQHFAWDPNPNVSDDIANPDFSFSVGGNSFFMPFLYEYSGSKSRRSMIPMVVFNAHIIFDKLRSIKFNRNGGETNAYEQLETIIRDRQTWGVHPNLGEHGEVNEFVQYALVDPDDASQAKDKEIVKKILGECPFKGDNTTR